MFARRVKHLIHKDFFVEEFVKELGKQGIEVTGLVSFKELKMEPKPTIEQLQAQIKALKEKYGEDE
jgi:hypothetical protein